MSKEIQTDRRVMIDGVISVIEECGFAAVTARSVAARLSISTQPIYREFGDMDGIKAAALSRGWEIFAEMVMTGDAKTQAVRYIKFATEHKNLFNFLFRGRNVCYDGLDDMAHKLVGTDIIDRLAEITHLPRERVYKLHLYVWMALHGLACMSADNDVRADDSELMEFTVELTRAVSSYFCGKGENDERA